MLKRVVIFSLCLLAVLIIEPDNVHGSSSAWQSLVPGLDYREYFLAGPNHVYVTRMDLSSPDLIVDTSLANGSMSGGMETVSDQAARYDQAINYWQGTWGRRNQVVAAINGGFYNTDSGVPANGMVQSGWYTKRFKDRQSIGGFAWGFNRQAFIFECLIQRPGAQEILLENSNETIRFDGINIPQSDGQLIIYTSHWGALTPSKEGAIEFVVGLDEPLGLSADFSPIGGTILDVKDGIEGVPIAFDQAVLTADEKIAVALKEKINPGMRIRISQEIRHLDNLCRKKRQPEMDNLYSALAGGSIFLREGRVQPLDDLGSVLRNPRTAVVLNDNHVFFVVVDGRDPLRSVGMSMVELAIFSRQYLDAQWGVAMDGGGSASLVINGKVVNYPNAETIVKAHIEKEPRAVANGLMMIQLQPEERSELFSPGEIVTVTQGSDANLRLGPGTNYLSQAVLPAGSQGVVVPHTLNGIQAKGFYWWKAAFSESAGWVSESVLTKAE